MAVFRKELGQRDAKGRTNRLQVRYEKNEPLLCVSQDETKQKRSVFKDRIAPTILAQEMQQLDEAGYVFATILEGEEKEVKKVIAMPGLVAAKTTSPGSTTSNPSTNAFRGTRGWCNSIQEQTPPQEKPRA